LGRESDRSSSTSVIFRPWKQMKKYVDGTWRMFNDFYVEEPD